GPASIESMEIALGNGVYDGSEASSVLACDYKIGVTVQTKNWTLNSPGRCAGALQCGQLRVSLLDANGDAVLPRIIAAGNGVTLDVSSLVNVGLRPEWKPPHDAGDSYTVLAELIEDSGTPYIELDGGDGSHTEDFYMKLPGTCDEGTAGAGAGAGGGAGGRSANGGSAGVGGATVGGGGSGDTGGATVGGGGSGDTGGATVGGGGSGDTGGATVGGGDTGGSSVG